MEIFRLLPRPSDNFEGVQFTGGAEMASQISEWLAQAGYPSSWRPKTDNSTEVFTVHANGRVEYFPVGTWIVKTRTRVIKKTTSQLEQEYVRNPK